MADAPEVVPNQAFNSTPEVVPNQENRSSPNLSRSLTTSANAPEVLQKSSTAVDESHPSSPSPPYQPTPDLKSFNSNASVPLSDRSKTVSPLAEPDKITPKFPIAEDERSDMKYAVEGHNVDNTSEGVCQPINTQIQSDDDAFATGARGLEDEDGKKNKKTKKVKPDPGDDEWHFGFWDICGDPSLMCECLTCPCILAGRTHARVKGVQDSDITSTNTFCFSCCICSTVFPFIYWAFTSATRRELRYKYGIKGSNGGDCLATGFCCPCACIQEERESRWREQRKLQSGDAGYGKRSEQMKYEPMR